MRVFLRAALAFGAMALWLGAATAQTIPFTFTDNRIFIPVSLNGHGPYSFILDTGSSDWDVSGAIAQQLDLKQVSSQNIQGAGESKVQSNIFQVADTAVGAARFRDQTFYSTDFSILERVIGFRHFDGIAGAQLFRAYAVAIDFDAGNVRLTDSAHYAPPPRAIRIPFTYADESTPLVSGTIAGVQGKFIVDTGDRSSLTLFGPFWRAHHLDKALGPVRDALTGYGVGGPIRGLVARVDKFNFGDAQVTDIVARLSLQKSGGFDDPNIAGSIGAGVLRHFHVTFDYAHKQIVLERGKNFDQPDRFDRSGLWLGRDFAVYGVMDNSPASDSGLQVGDTVTAVDGVSVSKIDLFALRARLADPKTKDVLIAYQRSSKTNVVRLKLRDLLPGHG